MAKALIIYGSTTGNTESVAETAARTLRAKGLKTSVKDVTEASLDDLNQGHDLILFGSSTWGDDDIEMQEDFAEFMETMEGVDLSGKKMAVFGCGDSTYTHFCGAVDYIQRKVEDLGAEVLIPGLKIDGDPSDAREEIEEWAESLAEAL